LNASITEIESDEDLNTIFETKKSSNKLILRPAVLKLPTGPEAEKDSFFQLGLAQSTPKINSKVI